MLAYYLGNTGRNKLLNCKEAVNSIFLYEEVAASVNTETCECEHSQFCDPHHKRIITGNFCIIDNLKLKKLMRKCPNYREPHNLNFNKAFEKTFKTLESLHGRFVIVTNQLISML